MRRLVLLSFLLIPTLALPQQNLVNNPGFEMYRANEHYDEIIGRGTNGQLSGGSNLYDYWDNCPYWQPPSKIWFCQHVGTANLHGNPLQRNGLSCAGVSKAELVVGGLNQEIVPENLYYFQIYSRYYSENSPYGPLEIVFSENRTKQCTYDWVTPMARVYIACLATVLNILKW
jgi:hypothetical protein